MSNELIYRDECYKIVGGLMEVHREKGCGFLEAVYQECLEIEFDFLGIDAVPHKELRLFYREKELKQKFIPDFICYNKIIVEIKACSNLVDEHRSQVINYLRATNYKLGLLVNFGSAQKLEWERFANTL